MITIRHGLFETNSSSTHTLILMKTSDFHKWYNSSGEEPDDDALFVIKLKDGKSSSVKLITEREVREALENSDSWMKKHYQEALEKGELWRAKEYLNEYGHYYLGAFPSGYYGDVIYEEFDDDHTIVSIYVPER